MVIPFLKILFFFKTINKIYKNIFLSSSSLTLVSCLVLGLFLDCFWIDICFWLFWRETTEASSQEKRYFY